MNEGIEAKKISRREQEVWQACDLLWKEIQAKHRSINDLTGSAIKSKLVELGYKRGNQNQIYQFRSSWKKNHQIDDTHYSSPSSSLGEPLNDRLEQAVASVMSLMQRETDEKITNAQIATKQQIDIHQEQMQSMQQQIHDQMLQLQEKDERLADLENELQLLQEERFALEKEYLVFKERTTLKNEYLEQALAEASFNNQNLNQKLTKLSPLYEKLQQQYLKEKATNHTLQHQLDSLMDKLITKKG